MILKQKFVKDFFDAVEIDKAITKNELDIITGTIMLKDMIIYVRKDIETLDENSYKSLKKIVEKLDETNSKRKQKIKQEYPEPENSLDERIFKSKL